MSDEKTINLARRIIAAYDQAREDVWPYSTNDIGNGPPADAVALARGVLRLGAERAELRALVEEAIGIMCDHEGCNDYNDDPHNDACDVTIEENGERNFRSVFFKRRARALLTRTEGET